MAARKTKRLNDDWREKIKSSMLVNRLQDHANGKVEMTKSQVTAAIALLKKTAPDLQAITLAGDAENPLKVINELGPELSKKLDRLANS